METEVDNHKVGLVDTVGYRLGGRVHRGLADRGLGERRHSLGLAGTGLHG